MDWRLGAASLAPGSMCVCEFGPTEHLIDAWGYEVGLIQ